MGLCEAGDWAGAAVALRDGAFVDDGSDFVGVATDCRLDTKPQPQKGTRNTVAAGRATSTLWDQNSK